MKRERLPNQVFRHELIDGDAGRELILTQHKDGLEISVGIWAGAANAEASFLLQTYRLKALVAALQKLIDAD